MRLKTKIILICCISTLLSSVVCSTAVYLLVKSNSIKAAQAQSVQNALAGFTELEKKIQVLQDRTDDELDREVLQYIMKQQRDDMLLCFMQETKGGDGAVYNETVFGQADLESLSYHPLSDLTVDEAELTWEGRHFFIYRQMQGVSYTIYKIEDITYVWERMRMLGIGLCILTCVITMFVCVFLFLILSRVLRPLKELNAGAKLIARGQYDERIPTRRKDEIGTLSENFNLMAEAVQSRIRQLEEAEWKRTLFMGNLTHELKTPMTAISGYAKTLLTVKLPEENKEEALSYIYEESCRLERLSKKMMNLLLLEENGEIERKEVAASVLFAHAAEACRQSLEEDGICLECHEEGEVFLADVDLFTEVLINLIDNARKASKRGDRILLSAREKVIEIQDFGTGIPEDEQEKILEPFYMIDKSRSRKSGGAGLGLAITALILKRHDCTIRMDSEMGQGTCVILQFV